MDNESLVTEHYDVVWAGVKPLSVPIQNPLRAWIEKWCPPGEGDCLEVGCYPGAYLEIFGRLGYTLHGIDLTKHLSDAVPAAWLVSQGFKVGSFVRGDFLSMDLGRQYDVVCSFGFIEHFANFREVLTKHINLVRPGGTLIVEAPNLRTGVQRMLFEAFNRRALERHYLPSMNPNTWANTVASAGMIVLWSGYFGGFSSFFLPSHRNSFLSWLAFGAFDRIINSCGRMFKGTSNPFFAQMCGLVAQKPLDYAG